MEQADERVRHNALPVAVTDSIIGTHRIFNAKSANMDLSSSAPWRSEKTCRTQMSKHLRRLYQRFNHRTVGRVTEKSEVIQFDERRAIRRGTTVGVSIRGLSTVEGHF